MNFLLHRHLASRDLGSTAAGIGAMLPDVWRMADRRVRPLMVTPAPRHDSDPELDAILAGIDHHIRADRWFHLSAMLTDGERLLSDSLRAAGVEAPKITLFSHVGWELCLDGALLRRDGLNVTMGEIRAGFGAATGESAGCAASLHHFDRVDRTADERSAFDAGVRGLFEEIGRGPWVERYLRGSGIVRAIQGIRVRLGFPSFSDVDLARVGDCIDDVAPVADAALEQILGHAPSR